MKFTKIKRGTETAVSKRPSCDIPECSGKAFADAATDYFDGSWGYVCRPHFNQFGCKLGLGQGQRLVVCNPPFSGEEE